MYRVLSDSTYTTLSSNGVKFSKVAGLRDEKARSSVSIPGKVKRAERSTVTLLLFL